MLYSAGILVNTLGILVAKSLMKFFHTHECMDMKHTVKYLKSCHHLTEEHASG